MIMSFRDRQDDQDRTTGRQVDQLIISLICSGSGRGVGRIEAYTAKHLHEIWEAARRKDKVHKGW
jgi:hypothetical protein